MFTAGSTSRGKGGKVSRYSHNYHPSLVYGDPRMIDQLIESIMEEKPKLLSKVLRKKNLDINLFIRFEDDVEKMTPLHYSAFKGKSELARTLLMSKLCSVDLQTPFDEATPLHFACRIPESSTALSIVSDLLLNGADVNITDHWEKTALIWACELGHYEVAHLLLSYQADYNHCYKIADHITENEREIPYFPSYLRKHAYKDQFHGNNALIQASRFGHLEIVKVLISIGCDVNAKNMKGSTALHAAAGPYYGISYNYMPESASYEVLEYLINSGADLNAKDVIDFTPLARSLVLICEICSQTVSSAEKVLPLNEAFSKMQLLIQAGSDVKIYLKFYSNSRITLLSQLLSFSEEILACKCSLLEKNLQKTIEMLVLCGCQVSSHDVQLAASLKMPALMNSILSQYENPLSLRQLCLICVRHNTKLPLKAHLAELDLPSIMIKNLSLE